MLERVEAVPPLLPTGGSDQVPRGARKNGATGLLPPAIAEPFVHPTPAPWWMPWFRPVRIIVGPCKPLGQRQPSREDKDTKRGHQFPSHERIPSVRGWSAPRASARKRSVDVLARVVLPSFSTLPVTNERRSRPESAAAGGWGLRPEVAEAATPRATLRCPSHGRARPLRPAGHRHRPGGGAGSSRASTVWAVQGRDHHLGRTRLTRSRSPHRPGARRSATTAGLPRTATVPH